MSVLRLAVLSEELVDKAFALIQLSDSTLTLESWRSLASRRLADEVAGRGGIIVLKDARDYLVALIDFARLDEDGCPRRRFAVRRICAPALLPGQSKCLAQELIGEVEHYIGAAWSGR